MGWNYRKSEIKFVPEELVFAFDLHRVILLRSWLEIFCYIRKMPGRGRFLRFFLNLRFLFNFLKIVSKTGVSDEVFELLISKHPRFAEFKDDFIEIANIQVVNAQVVGILKNLKKQGFRIYLLSNIGERALEDIKKKFPDIFSCFYDFYCPLKEDGYLQKPDFRFYEGFLNFLISHGDAGKKIFFVDDRKKNVEAANAMGFEGFRFRSVRGLKKRLKDCFGFLS